MYKHPAGTSGNICSHVVPAVRAMFIKVYECNDHVSYTCCLVKEFRFSPSILSLCSASKVITW